MRALTFRERAIARVLSEHFDDSVRLTWSLDVEVTSTEAARTDALRVDAWKSVPMAAMERQHPR